MHIPVLQKEVLEYLAPKPNENFIDATLGEGGHARAILEKVKPKGKVLGIEVDTEFYQRLKTQNVDRLILVNDSYADLKEIVRKYNFQPICGILFDLGLSSWHLEKSGRGFSFQRNEPLDMRFDVEGRLRAERIINDWPQKEIEKILREYGEERFASRIVQQIVAARKRKPIKTTLQLVEIIKRTIPERFQRGRNPATKTFQALRITVNKELENIQKVLPQALEILEEKGKIVVISFHSLEDRLVKNFFKTRAQKGLLNILTKKPVTSLPDEVQQNPRSRSAKLRAAIKI